MLMLMTLEHYIIHSITWLLIGLSVSGNAMIIALAYLFIVGEILNAHVNYTTTTANIKVVEE